MLPRWHIFWGGVFTAVLYLFIPTISLFSLSLVFLSSFLIDFDHYLNGVWKKGAWNLKDNFNYHKKKGFEEKREIKRGIRKRGDFHLFHTIEFHLLIGLIGIYHTSFYYIFMGMVFHSLLDVVYLVNLGKIHRREYFLINWILR